MNCIWILLLLFCSRGNQNSGAVTTNDCGCDNHNHHNHCNGCNASNVNNSCNANNNCNTCNNCNNCDNCNTCNNQRTFSYASYPVLDNCDCN